MTTNASTHLTAAPSRTLMVYVGSYTKGPGPGIHLFHLDLAMGKLTPAGVAPDVISPSFLAFHPNHRFLYAVNEVGSFEGKPTGGVTALAIDPATGGLSLLNAESSGGSGPCHIAVDKTGRMALVANYNNGSVASLPIGPDGRLGPPASVIQHHGSSVNPQRQEGPHAHSVTLDASNQTAFAADLGLDKYLVYRVDPEKATLTPIEAATITVAPGSGPRHFAFHPDGRWAYSINELNSTVTAFAYDQTRHTLETIQTVSTLPEGFTGTNYPAEVQVSRDGRFLYGSNRGQDAIVIYRIDPATGRLTLVGHQPTGGKNPRNFSIDPTGEYLLAANQDTGNVVVFHIDRESGKLTPTGQSVDVPMAVCVVMMPFIPNGPAARGAGV